MRKLIATDCILVMLWLIAAASMIWSVEADAQIVEYPEGQAPPADLWDRPQPASAPVPLVDVQCAGWLPGPDLQTAHNGRYTALSGPGVQLDYRQIEDRAFLTLLAPDGRYYMTAFVPSGASVLAPLYDAAGAEVGEIKLCSTTAGAPCGQIKARARVFGKLLFPIDPNLACAAAPPAAGPYCIVQSFGAKIGEAGAGPETCIP